MAQQQQNISISAPGFQGLNTEESPLAQDPEGFAGQADNCVIDAFGRVGCPRPSASYTENDNVPYVDEPTAVSTASKVSGWAAGIINGVRYDICTVSHVQTDAVSTILREDYYIAQINGVDLDALAYPTLGNPRALSNAKIVSFNNAIYIFSKGNAPPEV